VVWVGSAPSKQGQRHPRAIRGLEVRGGRLLTPAVVPSSSFSEASWAPRVWTAGVQQDRVHMEPLPSQSPLLEFSRVPDTWLEKCWSLLRLCRATVASPLGSEEDLSLPLSLSLSPPLSLSFSLCLSLSFSVSGCHSASHQIFLALLCQHLCLPSVHRPGLGSRLIDSVGFFSRPTRDAPHAGALCPRGFLSPKGGKIPQRLK
jgi:hypothetical protein